MPPLTAGSVHVWAASLDVPGERRRELVATLSRDERDRSARYRDPGIARRWETGRGLLREMLAAYLDVEPGGIRFDYSAYGKPAIAVPAGEPPVRFNVSHSGGLALYGFSARAPIGVDTEQLVRFADMTDVAERFFSPAERAGLTAVPPAHYTLAFYCCWTRKEAYLKACGTGLSTPLDSFDVSVVPGEPPALLRVQSDAAACERWSFVHLRPAEEFVGALAVEVPSPRVSCWRWPR